MKTVKLINCKRCWKQIEQKWPRVYCIPCRKIIDRDVAKKYREEHLEEFRERQRNRARERARVKREALKRDE